MQSRYNLYHKNYTDERNDHPHHVPHLVAPVAGDEDGIPQCLVWACRQGLEEDEQGSGQETSSYSQGEKEAGEGIEKGDTADITTHVLGQVNNASKC